jgi:hypothetical protein
MRADSAVQPDDFGRRYLRRLEGWQHEAPYPIAQAGARTMAA